MMQLPQSVDLEMCVLGAIMLDPERAYKRVAGMLPADVWYLDGHRLVYEAITRLAEKGTPPDSVAVIDAMRGAGTLDKAGGAGVIMGMLNSVATSGSVEHHAAMIADKASRRRIIAACLSIADHAADEGFTATEVVDYASAHLGALDTSGGAADESTILTSADVARMMATGKDIPRWSSGFADIDTMAEGGFGAQELWVVGAASGTGKTRIMLYAAAACKVPSAFVSLEMSDYQLAKYHNSTLASLHRTFTSPAMLVDGGSMQAARWSDVNEAAALSNMRLVSKPGGCSMAELRGYVRYMAKAGCRVIVVDQAQRIREFNEALRTHNRPAVASMVDRIKSLAADNGCCIVLLHQINREGYGKPSLGNLYESAAFEHLADAVLLLWDKQTALIRDKEIQGYVQEGMVVRKPRQSDWSDGSVKTDVTNPRPITLLLEKSRAGATGASCMLFDYRYGVQVDEVGAGRYVAI